MTIAKARRGSSSSATGCGASATGRVRASSARRSHRWRRAHDCRRRAAGVRVSGPARALLAALRDSAIGPAPATGAAAFTALARLKPGVTLAQAEAEGTAAARAAPQAPAHRVLLRQGRPRRRARTRAGRRHDRARAARVVGPGRRRCARAPDCVRQRHEPPAVARRDPTARAGHPGGRRWKPRADRAAAVHRERGRSRSQEAHSGLMLAWWLVRLLPASRHRACRAWTPWRSMAGSWCSGR